MRVTMTPEEFISKVRDGEIEVDASYIEGDMFATVRRTMTLDDEPEGLTAEAFQHGAFDPEKHSWDAALRRIRELIKLLR